ncbi:DUF1203 domain-containing protein [uncultured Aquimarina sp.]|uniref:DUF1203 domain-containing protein n=1 Tax=uncultured Aquimarina sp. TaxID=575652 RepID=UPI00263876DE|nr:DUF1203 domain-containing protein [uncultured Aquimarina sp.]
MNHTLHNFQIKAINQNLISPLFELSDSELAKQNALRILVDQKPGFPCRVSLEDANIGEEVLLFSYQHHDAASPYKASGPIFARKNAKTSIMKTNEIPTMLTDRLLSVRGYDNDSMMIDAKTIHGLTLFDTIQVLFNNSKIKYLHIHNANPGCYNCQVDRLL